MRRYIRSKESKTSRKFHLLRTGKYIKSKVMLCERCDTAAPPTQTLGFMYFSFLNHTEGISKNEPNLFFLRRVWHGRTFLRKKGWIVFEDAPKQHCKSLTSILTMNKVVQFHPVSPDYYDYLSSICSNGASQSAAGIYLEDRVKDPADFSDLGSTRY